jgi:hypothetical protein
MKSSRQRGSLLIILMIFLIILTTTAVTVLEMSRTSYRISMQNKIQTTARAIAEAEMEYLYFRFKSQVLAGTAAQGVPAAFVPTTGLNLSDNSATPTTAFTPFLQAFSNEGWTIRRSLIVDRYLQNERLPGTTKEGSFTYLIARVSAIPPVSSPFYWADPPSPDNPTGTVRTFSIGRRFTNSSAPIFQYSIFFQGDLEFNPGGAITTTISGDVVANGSIYMGPQSGGNIMINGKVRYLSTGFFNTNAVGTVTYSNPNAPTPPITLVAPTWATSEASQLETLEEPENLLGGIDVTVTAIARGNDLFGPAINRGDPTVWTAAELATAENNVYRSLIVPPPSADNVGNNTDPNKEFPLASTATIPSDDPVISAQRAYNKSALQISVADDASGTIIFTKVDLLTGTRTDVTNRFIDDITNFGTNASPVYFKDVWDFREGKFVRVTEIDIGDLKDEIDYQRNLPPANPHNVDLKFNGLLYVNLLRASAATPAAIRLKDATALPYTSAVPATSGLGGFSVATNGGIYVVGSYNTATPVEGGLPVFPKRDGTAGYVPAMLIADAITLLSTDWNDDNAALGIGSRIAAAGTVSFNAGILTGNIPSTITASSGGAHNLVRYLEDWRGRNVNYFGSIGRLFRSTKFVAPFGGVGSVYWNPSRTFSFDQNILTYAPPGTPQTTSFSRGSFFNW